MKLSGKFLLLAVISALLIFAALPVSAQDDHVLVLENGTASLDGAPVPEYDYAWHADPSVVHDEVKDAPAEYYTGTEPSGEDAVYIAHDIFYYPEVPAEGFKKVRYDDDTEWVYYYPAEEYQDFIWANLPYFNRKRGRKHISYYSFWPERWANELSSRVHEERILL